MPAFSAFRVDAFGALLRFEAPLCAA